MKALKEKKNIILVTGILILAVGGFLTLKTKSKDLLFKKLVEICLVETSDLNECTCLATSAQKHLGSDLAQRYFVAGVAEDAKGEVLDLYSNFSEQDHQRVEKFYKDVLSECDGITF